MDILEPRKTVEELAREQGVAAGALDAWLAGPWSDEEDEEVNAFIAMRRERRAWELTTQDAEEFPVPSK